MKSKNLPSLCLIFALSMASSTINCMKLFSSNTLGIDSSSILRLPKSDPNYKWKIIIVQDKDYPPYETNGEGPQYTDKDLRLRELGPDESMPPHPEMPDEEPAVFLEMEKKLSLNLGIPAPIMERNDSQMTESSREDFEKQRFAELNEGTDLLARTKSKYLSNNDNKGWVQVPFVHAWASSVYTWKWWWWWHTYHAHNAIHGWSYWSSTGGHKKNDVIIWQGDFDRTRRIHHIWVRWAYAPGKYSVQATPDGTTYEEKIPWKNAANSWLSNWWHRVYWWWRWWYRSYSEHIIFPDPIWALKIRILMKEPEFYFFGIYRVEAWTPQFTVMLKNGAGGSEEECLALQEADFLNGREIVVRPCIDSISKLDGRELFILKPNMQITTFVGNLCMEPSNGDTSENARIHIYNCASSTANGDSRERWHLDHKGLLKSMKDSGKCLTITSGEISIGRIGNLHVRASSTMNDGQHEPKLAVDGNSESGNYWASSPGASQVSFHMTFNTLTVKEVVIKWKYPAKGFDVQGLLDGYWRSFAFLTTNAKSENKINFGYKTISGLKISMMTSNSDLNGKPVYGINEIELKTGSKNVGLRDCSTDNGGMNKWFIDDVFFTDLTVPPQVRAEYRTLYQNTNKLLDILNVLISWPSQIIKMIEKAKELRARIQDQENCLNDIDLRMTLFRTENLVEEEKQAMENDSKACIGSTAIKPAKSCDSIKRVYPFKRSGYYWVKPFCSKMPLRVYCDYESNKLGLAYAYYGGLEQGKDLGNNVKSVKDVRYICSKLGLEPVQINNKRQLDVLNKYLIDIGVNMASKAIVPIGYDYGCGSGKCSDHYSSFNNERSPDITEAVNTKLDKRNFLNSAWSKTFNAKKDDAVGYGLSNSGMVTFKLQGDIPVKGVVCSTNSDGSEWENEWVQATCDTIARGNMEFDGIVNTNIKVRCPAGCSNQGSTKVWGSELFRDDSSICKAAIHNDRIKAEVGGLIEVGIENGAVKYKGSLINGITSEDYSGPWDRSIVINTHVLRCPQDDFKVATSFLEYENSFNGDEEKEGSEGESSTDSEKSSSTSGNSESTSSSKVVGAAATKTSVNNSSSTTNESSSLKRENKEEQLQQEHGAEEQDQKLSIEKIENTKQAIEKLENLMNMDKEDLRRQIRLVSDSNTLLNKLGEQISPLVTSDISPDFQLKYLDSLDMHVLGELRKLEGVIKKKKFKRFHRGNEKTVD